MNRCSKLAKKYLNQRKIESDRQKFINQMLIVMAERNGDNNDTGAEAVHTEVREVNE